MLGCGGIVNRSVKCARLTFRHPPASRAFAAQTGGRSGAREREPVAHAFAEPFRLRFAPAPLRPPVSASLRRRMTKMERPEFTLAEVYGVRGAAGGDLSARQHCAAEDQAATSGAE
jgi:hypothetical protein